MPTKNYKPPKTKQVRRRYLSENTYKRILAMRGCGIRMTDIARRFDISYYTVRDIITGRHKPWKPSGAALSRSSPTAEATDLNPVQSAFESRERDQTRA